jgi:hypothetical protein
MQDMNIPKECTKSEFARLLGVDPANVSRWSNAGRLDLNGRGRVLVLASLTKLLATLDPGRGGRAGQRGAGDGGTIDTCRRLLEQAGTKAEPTAQVAELQAQLSEAIGQLEHERTWRKANCYHRDEEAGLRCRLVDAMAAQWGELTAARKAGGNAFDRIMYRIECRIYLGLSDEVIAVEEAEMFDGE